MTDLGCNAVQFATKVEKKIDSPAAFTFYQDSECSWLLSNKHPSTELQCYIPTEYTRWFKYDRDYLFVNKSQFVPVIFEPPCIIVQ
jgi:hypothetical protein